MLAPLAHEGTMLWSAFRLSLGHGRSFCIHVFLPGNTCPREMECTDPGDSFHKCENDSAELAI